MTAVHIFVHANPEYALRSAYPVVFYDSTNDRWWHLHKGFEWRPLWGAHGNGAERARAIVSDSNARVVGIVAEQAAPPASAVDALFPVASE